MTTVVRRHLTWVTSLDGLEHAVTDAAMVAGMAAGAGEYAAVCGVVALSDAMTAPPGSCCPVCSARVRLAVSRLPARRRHGRPSRVLGVVRRLFLLSPVVWLCLESLVPRRGMGRGRWWVGRTGRVREGCSPHLLIARRWPGWFFGPFKPGPAVSHDALRADTTPRTEGGTHPWVSR